MMERRSRAVLTAKVGRSPYWLVLRQHAPAIWTIQAWGPEPLLPRDVFFSEEAAKSQVMTIFRAHVKSKNLPVVVPKHLNWKVALSVYETDPTDTPSYDDSVCPAPPIRAESR